MIVWHSTTTILSLQLILLLLSRHVTSISLSQFQQIQGFSDSCENVWQEDIPGCTKKDFATSNSCSRNCLAGVNIINAEVLVACADARVSSNTLLGEFLAGFGVSALCGSSDTTTATIADSTTATATAVKTTATSTSLTSVHSTKTTTTAVQETTTPPSVLSTTASVTTSTPSSVTTSTTATSITDLTLSFTGTTTTSPTSIISSPTTSAKTSSTSSSNTEAKGFGGVGDAFDILGGESGGNRLEYVSWNVMSLMSVLVIAVARGIW
jgi:hypothetical protein